MALILPVRLTQEQIAEFKKLYKKYFNIELNNEEANEKGVKFLQFLTVIINNNEAFFN